MNIRGLKFIFYFAVFASLAQPFYVAAADVSIHGFVQGNYSFGTRANPDGGDFKWAEERVQLKLDANKGYCQLFYANSLKGFILNGSHGF